jgi:hypothetical protein
MTAALTSQRAIRRIRMSAIKTTTRTKDGKCPVHGNVQGEKDFPVASWPLVAYLGRRVSAQFKPYHCPQCGAQMA